MQITLPLRADLANCMELQVLLEWIDHVESVAYPTWGNLYALRLEMLSGPHGLDANNRIMPKSVPTTTCDCLQWTRIRSRVSAPWAVVKSGCG